MPISLNKPRGGVGLTRVGASLVARGEAGAARLTVALYLADRGDDLAIVDHRNACWGEGAVALTSGAADGESVEIDLVRVPAKTAAIAMCMSLIGTAPGGTAATLGALRLVDLVEGDEIGAYDLVEVSGHASYEFGRFERAGDGWRFRSTGRDPGPAFERAVRRDPLIARPIAVVAPLGQRPPEPQDAFRAAIAARGLAGYCDVDERAALLREGARVGLAAATAQALLDLTLERGGIANEAVLLEGLDKMLRQFTDQDRKLDPKEQRDALQMVCRPAPGYTKGLRADVADRAVIDFCRARGVKLRTGWLGWKVP